MEIFVSKKPHKKYKSDAFLYLPTITSNVCHKKKFLGGLSCVWIPIRRSHENYSMFLTDVRETAENIVEFVPISIDNTDQALQSKDDCFYLDPVKREYVAISCKEIFLSFCQLGAKRHYPNLKGIPPTLSDVDVDYVINKNSFNILSNTLHGLSGFSDISTAKWVDSRLNMSFRKSKSNCKMEMYTDIQSHPFGIHTWMWRNECNETGIDKNSLVLKLTNVSVKFDH